MAQNESIPAWGKPGPDKGTAFGIAAVAQALEGLNFPTSKQEIAEHANDKVIEYRKDMPVTLSSMVELLDEKEYPAMSVVLQEMGDKLTQLKKERGSVNQEKVSSANNQQQTSNKPSKSKKSEAITTLLNLLTDKEFIEGLRSEAA